MNARDTMPAARILHVDDQPESHEWLKLALERKQYEVTVATDGQSALSSFTTHRPDVVLLDHELPDQSGLEVLRHLKNADPLVEVVMLTGHGSVSLAVEAMREGAFNFVEKPVEFAVLEAVLDKALAHRNLHAEAARLRMSHERRDGLGRLVGTSPAMRRLFDLITLVAPTDASVLIRGENGTGKELVADAVHERSPRINGPIIKINCGAIPGELFESELFGHKRGAFTGAFEDHPGLFQRADGGTVFLDEIGETSPAFQVKLLRVLQEGEVRPVGAARPVPVDVRIIAATHRNLEQRVREGQFREDLYYRLNVVTLHLPTLAERREDIPLLANHFLAQLAAKYGKRSSGFAPEALKALTMASWPGNVRQLYNVVEQVCALSTTPLVSLALVQRALRTPSVEVLSFAEARQRFEREYLVGLLKMTDGNVADAARLAQRNRTEFYRLLQRHGLTPELFRGDRPDVEQ